MTNIVPAESSGFEVAGSLGDWIPWFGASLTQTGEDSHSGTGSMRVEATDGSIGVQLDNWPGWSIPAGGIDYRLAWWVKGPATTLKVQANWRDESGTTLTTVDVPVDTSPAEWRQGATVVTAPVDAARLWMQISGSASTGEVFYVDDVVADDQPTSPATESAARIWDGQAWQTVPAGRRWDGAVWQDTATIRTL